MQVLAGALKDNGRARIVGERTFGKGLIQTIVELSDGSGVAVTVARYQTPAGTDINKVHTQSAASIFTFLPVLTVTTLVDLVTVACACIATSASARLLL